MLGKALINEQSWGCWIDQSPCYRTIYSLSAMTITLHVVRSTCSLILKAETWVSSSFLSILDFLCIWAVSRCKRAWWDFVHFLHICVEQHFSAICPLFKQSIQRPSSQAMLILFVYIHLVNALQVCIWWTCFLQPRHVSSVDTAKDCFIGILQSVPGACLCPVWDTLKMSRLEV